MAKKKPQTVAHGSTYAAAPIMLDLQQKVTLRNIVTQWNNAARQDPPRWDDSKVLAELARNALTSMAPDYSDEPRPPTFPKP